MGTIAVAIFWLVMSCIMKKYNKSNDVDHVEKLAKDLNYLVSIPCLVAFIIIFFMFLAVIFVFIFGVYQQENWQFQELPSYVITA